MTSTASSVRVCAYSNIEIKRRSTQTNMRATVYDIT
jgi:hypothetical protein